MGREHKSKQIAVICAVLALSAAIFYRLSFEALKGGASLIEIGIKVGMPLEEVQILVGPFYPSTMGVFQTQKPGWDGYEFWFASPSELVEKGKGLRAVTKKIGEAKVFVLPSGMAGQICKGKIHIVNEMNAQAPMRPVKAK